VALVVKKTKKPEYMFLQDFIIKNSVPIIEIRIKEIIARLAKEFSIPANDIQLMLKDNLKIYAFYNNKRIKEVPFSEIGGEVFETAGSFIQQIFLRDAVIYNVNPAFVNYMFQIDNINNLAVCRNIKGIYEPWTRLKKIMFPEEI
jgi:hypothetical protein